MKTVLLQDIRQQGLKILKKNLGTVGAIRFIQEINYGAGDYTKERGEWLENQNINEIYMEIKDKRNKKHQ